MRFEHGTILLSVFRFVGAFSITVDSPDAPDMTGTIKKLKKVCVSFSFNAAVLPLMRVSELEPQKYRFFIYIGCQKCHILVKPFFFFLNGIHRNAENIQSHTVVTDLNKVLQFYCVACGIW